MGQTERELQKYGEPLVYDRSFKGPLSKRSCTDVLCLLIFVVFLEVWGYVAYYAITNGDLNKLLVPTDSQNLRCGVDTKVIKKPYLLFFDLEKCIDPLVPITGCPTPQVCVENCPTENFIFDLDKTKYSIAELKKKLICVSEERKQQIPNTLNEIENAIEAGICARWYVKSTPFLNRCLWKFSTSTCEYPPLLIKERYRRDISLIQQRFNDTTLLNTGSNATETHKMGQMIVEDIIDSWFTILLGLIIAMSISLIFIAVMRWLASPIIWFSIIGVLAMLGYGIYYGATQYIYFRDNPQRPTSSLNLQDFANSYLHKKDTWLYIMIILAVIFVIIFLMVIFLRKRIIIAIALVKEGSKAVSTMISTVFFPIFPWILQVSAIGFAVAIGLYLASVGDCSYIVVGKVGENEKCICTGRAKNYLNGASCDPQLFNTYCKIASVRSTFTARIDDDSNDCLDAGCYFEKIASPKLVPYFQAYNIIGFFWLVFFISAFGEMVLAATFASWYWTFHKSDVPYFILSGACARTIRYNLGTLAFGSLIITICRLIRVILEYIDTKLKKYDNAFTRAILCCLKCFFWCLENFLRFINKNAYIMCAIHGKNFCSSAKDAFNLLMRNFLRVITLDKVTDFLFFLSKVLITLAIGFGVYFYADQLARDNQLHYKAVPTVLVMLGTYLITTVFFGVYSMAVDTLFLCFLEDCERNDGSAEKPYYMSKQLMKILGRKNEIPRHQYR